MRYDSYGKGLVQEVCNGETYAVYGDRTLEGDVTRQLSRRGYFQDSPPSPANGLEPPYRADAVHVAEDEMTAEAVGGPQLALQIHPVAGAKLPHRGPRQRFGHRFHRKPLTRQ